MPVCPLGESHFMLVQRYIEELESYLIFVDDIVEGLLAVSIAPLSSVYIYSSLTFFAFR